MNSRRVWPPPGRSSARQDVSFVNTSSRIDPATQPRKISRISLIRHTPLLPPPKPRWHNSCIPVTLTVTEEGRTIVTQRRNDQNTRPDEGRHPVSRPFARELDLRPDDLDEETDWEDTGVGPPHQRPAPAEPPPRTRLQEPEPFETAPAGSPAALEEIADLRRQLDESLAREKRWLADLDNYRRRTERMFEEQADLRKRAFAVDLLDVLDDLDRALEHAAEPEATLAQGVQAIRDKILAIFARHGIKPFNPLDEPFDPVTQEAVATLHQPELPDHTVAEVVRVGWKAGDKLLRPAHVVVVKNQ